MEKYIITEYALKCIIRILAKRLSEEQDTQTQREIIEALAFCNWSYMKPLEEKQETEEDQ